MKYLEKIRNILRTAKFRSKKKVSINLMGGLGNQLFQIATVLAYSWKYSLIPIFKKIKESPSRVKSRPVYWKNVFQKLYVTNHLPPELVDFDEKNFNYHKIPNPNLIMNLNLSKGIIFNGYFQSAKYFDPFRERLLSCLYFIKSSEKKYLKKKYLEIFDKERITVSLHIRRDDNITEPAPVISPYLWDTDYYQKSITFFQEKFYRRDLLFCIFSDDINWSKKFLKEKFPKLDPLFIYEKDYLDLYLMSCCKHQIVANSSFSWWAAYLNNSPEKIVIAPKIWFGPEGPPNWEDIYIIGWVKF